MADIRLDNFTGGPINDSHLYVVLTTHDTFLTGTWDRTAATLSGFPLTGRWVLVHDAGGVVVEDQNGKLLCTLEGLLPGSEDKDGDVLFSGDDIPYSTAKWHIQE